MIRLRKTEECLVYGDFEVINKEKDRFVYKRTWNGEEFFVDCNLGKTMVPAYEPVGVYQPMFLSEGSNHLQILQPYEARIWKKSKLL